MQNPTDLSENASMALEAIGGDPLAGSGFEAEESQPEFDETEPINTEQPDYEGE